MFAIQTEWNKKKLENGILLISYLKIEGMWIK